MSFSKSTEETRKEDWQRIRDRHSHSTEKETMGYYAEAVNRRDVAARRIATLEAEIATGEKLTCEDINIASDQADELEEFRAKFLSYNRLCLSEQRTIYESARASAASFEAAFRFEKTSDLVKWHGSIFKEKPQPKKRATATRSRKTSRG
jgi:hypothetical protein